MIRHGRNILCIFTTLIFVLAGGITGCSQDDEAPGQENTGTATSEQFPGTIPSDCEVIDGGVSISTDAELAAFSGLDCFVVEGGLFVRDSADITDLSALEGLHGVDGYLGIARNDALVSIDLPNLIDVGEGVVIEGNTSLVDLDLALLHNVGAEVHVFNNPALETISAPWLVDVGGDLLLTGLGALTTLDFLRLDRVGGRLVLERLSSLQCVCMPALSEVGSDLMVRFNAALQSASFPSLAAVGGNLSVERNAVLQVLDMPLLATVAADVVISFNPELAQCSVDALIAQMTIGGSTTTTNNSIVCPPTPLTPEDVGCAACTSGDPPPSTPDAGQDAGDDAGQDAGDDAGQDAGDPDEFPGTIPSDCEVIVGGVSISTDAELAAFSGLDCFVVEGGLFVRDSADITDLSALEGLHGVDGYLGIARNDALTSIDLPNLIDVGEGVVIEGNTSLVDLDLALLHNVGAEVHVFNNPALETISAPWLVDVGGDLLLTGLGALTTLDFLRLDRVGGRLVLERLSSLQCVCMPALSEVGSDLMVRFNAALQSASFPNLAAVGGNLSVERNAVLQVLDMPLLATVAADVVISFNPELAQCSVDALIAHVTIGGSTTTTNNSSVCPPTPLTPEDVGCAACTSGDVSPPPSTPDAGQDAGDDAGQDAGDDDAGAGSLAIEAVSTSDNPNSEISAFLHLQTSEPAFFEVHAETSDHQFSLIFDDDAVQLRDQLLIGFRPNRTYQLTVRAFTSGGAEATEQLQYVTGALPPDLTNIDVTISNPSQMQPGVTLFNLWRWSSPTQLDSDVGYIVGIDEHGEVVWYYQATHRPTAVHVLQNGDIAYQWGFGRIVVIDLAGNVVQQYLWHELGLESIHHEVYEMPNGNLLTLSADLRVIDGYTDENGDPVTYNVVGDDVVEFTRDGQIVHQHSLHDVLDPHYFTSSFHVGFWDGWYGLETKDWTHGNSVVYDPSDDSYIVSARHLNWAVKIDRQTGDLVWRLGENGDFSLLSGQWFYHQHAVSVLDSGNILMFDNGNGRPSVTDGQFYSRAVEYSIDSGGATQVWEFRDDELFYSRFLSDADRLDNGNVLVTDGGRFGDLGDAEDLPFARLVEVTHDADPIKVFEVYLRDFTTPQVGYSIYRADRIDLLGVLESR